MKSRAGKVDRRSLLLRLATALPAASIVGAALRTAAAEWPQGKLPPVRKITRGPKFHWRGYYDKLLFDSTNRFVLANEAAFEGRTPQPDDVLRVGMIDTHDNDRWIALGSTTAWNWQQGCMLQWIPRSEGEVIWNDREDGGYVCRILDVKSGQRRTLPHPIYCLSPDGKTALSPDFRRLNDCRPGYGYNGIPDPNVNVLAPDDAGAWKMDMTTGKRDLVLTFADVAKIPYTGQPDTAIRPTSKHWFNHLLFNTDGKRFWFLHRWHAPGDKLSFNTRAFTASPDGKDLYCLDPHGRTSHFVWRDASHVMAFAWHPSFGERFYLYTDKTDRVEVVGKNQMTVNGHNTYVPGTDNQWVLNDTYPVPGSRMQNPYLFHIPTNRKIPLGQFFSPPQYKDEFRCDNHPCASRDGKWAVIDSPHDEGRQLYLIEIGGIVGA